MPSSAGCPSHAVSVTNSHIFWLLLLHWEYSQMYPNMLWNTCHLQQALTSYAVWRFLAFWLKKPNTLEKCSFLISLNTWWIKQAGSFFKIAVTIHCQFNKVCITPTLSWELSITLMLLSEEVTSGPNSTLPRNKSKWHKNKMNLRIS